MHEPTAVWGKKPAPAGTRRHSDRVILVLDTAVTLFGLAMAAAPLLQLRRMMKLGRAEEVSLGMLGVLVTGGGLWLLYGIAHNAVALMVCNAVGVGCSLSALIVAWFLRRGPSPRMPRPAEEHAAPEPAKRYK